MAAALLDRNVNNRTISNRNYQVLIRAMQNGEWELNGEAIKIDREGFVLDGQHRLHAVVESGITIPTFLIEGLPPSTQETMDTGKARSLRDILQIRGERDSINLAAISRRVFIYKRHGLRQATVASYPTTNKEVLRFLDENPWVRELPAPAKRVGRQAKLPASVTGLLMVAFQEVDQDDADYFFSRLEDGTNLGTNHPILVLRSVLSQLHGARGATNQTYLSAITIKAWNKFRLGEEVRQLKYRPGGANPERFPEPH